MPIRIYALAKQLKLDSKTLVDICEQAGVTGKGSALASLTDEELEIVKAAMNAGGRTPRAASAPAAPKRPSPASGAPEALRRDDYLTPSGASGGRVPVLPERPSAEKKPGARTSGAASSERDKSGPAIKLAPIPTAQAPPVTAGPAEPAAQRPDIRLPADAIRASRLGEEPLAKQLEKHEKTQRDRAAAKKPAPRRDKDGGPAATDAGTPAATPGRGGRRGRVVPAAVADADAAPLLGGREERQLKRKRVSTKREKSDRPDETPSEEPRAPRRSVRRLRRTGTNTAAPRKSNVVLQLPCTVRTFSEAVGVGAGQVLAKLLALGAGVGVNINAELEPEMAELLAVELGVEVDLRRTVDIEDRLIATAEEEEDDPSLLEPRPPVITFLGHVDHGKTSLLDRIIGIDVASGEKGGITQHIRAYQVKKDGRAISFVDTPGHEAFTAMRARGANVTDIAVLVVAADDGVMPQTEEAISHAKAAGVPIVVALNKIDLPGVSGQRTYEQLAANELLPSEWGGETEVIPTSAVTGQGLDTLLETLLTVAELREFKANPNRPAMGTCLESELHEGRGVVAKFLVEKGTLHVGDVVVCGSAYGRVKAMYDTLKPSKRYKEAGPSMPVSVTGMDEAPGAGDRFHVVSEISEAREIAGQRAAHARQTTLAGGQTHVTLENLFERLGQRADVQTLNIILRADVRGSIEAIRKELTKLEHPEVQIKILQATVGGITEADVHLADASDAVIIGFSVVPDEAARQLADVKGVQIRRYDIIYQVTADLKAALEGMLKPEKQERELGRALVQRVFQISRLGTIAGCRVLAGSIERDCRVRVIRENRIIGDYSLDSLKREKDDAREVREGYECGMRLRGFNDLKEADILEAYKVEEIARKF